MSASYSSDDAPAPPLKKPVAHRPPKIKAPRKPIKNQQVMGMVRILKRGEVDDDEYVDTGSSKEEAEIKKKKGKQVDVHTQKVKQPKKVKKPAAAMVPPAPQHQQQQQASKKKKSKSKDKEASVPAPLPPPPPPQVLAIAFLNPPSRPSTPQPVKVYGLETPKTTPVTIRTRTFTTTPSKSASPPSGGEYAGPTFSNSPAPSTLPKPAFFTQKTSPPTLTLERKKSNGLADVAFWMEGGAMSGANTTANATPSESPGSRSGMVTPTRSSSLAPIPTHRNPYNYTDDMHHVGNPSTRMRSNSSRLHDDGGSGSMLLGLLRGQPQVVEEPQNDLDVWSQGLKSLLKMN